MISLIAAIGKNRELGKENALLFNLPEDMKFFRETTTNHPVLMGKNTFDSIGRPLPKRQNYVATRHPEDLPEGVTPVTDLDAFLKQHFSNPTAVPASVTDTELFVIGGANIYEQALPYATTLYLTEVNASRPDADVFFPVFDPSNYERTIIKKGKDHDLTYDFAKYSLK